MSWSWSSFRTLLVTLPCLHIWKIVNANVEVTLEEVREEVIKGEDDEDELVMLVQLVRIGLLFCKLVLVVIVDIILRICLLKALVSPITPSLWQQKTQLFHLITLAIWQIYVKPFQLQI